tara:strand:+ start:731 stop:856 length:126 start_codon:yes stop_codon:yes gene_type:complete
MSSSNRFLLDNKKKATKKEIFDIDSKWGKIVAGMTIRLENI